MEVESRDFLDGPKQGTRVWSLVQEDPTYRGATKPELHNSEKLVDLGGRVVLCSLQLEESLLSDKDPAQPKLKDYFFFREEKEYRLCSTSFREIAFRRIPLPCPRPERVTTSHVSSLTLDRVVRQNWGKCSGFRGDVLHLCGSPKHTRQPPAGGGHWPLQRGEWGFFLLEWYWHFGSKTSLLGGLPWALHRVECCAPSLCNWIPAPPPSPRDDNQSYP